MSAVTATIERNGAVLPIVTPGISRGKISLTQGNAFTSQVIQGQAIYVFCRSLIHLAEGTSVRRPNRRTWRRLFECKPWSPGERPAVGWGRSCDRLDS
jgi:hypothetical protein